MEPTQPQTYPTKTNNVDGMSPLPQSMPSITPQQPAVASVDEATITHETVFSPSTESSTSPSLSPEASSTPASTGSAINSSDPQNSQSASVAPASSVFAPQVSVIQDDSGQGNPTPGVFKSPSAPKKRRFNKKLLLTLILPLVLLIGGGASATYFAYIVPNKPENMWNKSLVNMGKAYDKLTSYSSDMQKDFKGLTIKGSYKATGPLVSEGTIDNTSFENNSTAKVGIKVDTKALNIETRTLGVKDSQYPDIYFKISGIKTLLGDSLSGYDAVIKTVEGQWISIDHTYLNKLATSAGAENQTQVSPQDVTEIQQAVGEVSKQWVFTDNPDQQVIEIKQKVGKETKDGRATYHYKAQIDKNNLKSYLKALRDKLKDTNLFKTTFKTFEISKATDSDIDKEVDSMDTNTEFDVWVDTHTKLFHVVRVGPANDYTEVSQDYQGGDSVPMGIKVYRKNGSETDTADIKATLDMKTSKVDMTFDVAVDKEKVTGTLTISKNTKDIKVEKPTGARPLQDVVNQIAGYKVLGVSTVISSAEDKDAERKADIKILQTKLEAYNVKNGFYPTLAVLNDPVWSAKNLNVFNKGALKDPDGTNSTIVSSPTKNIYAYAPTIQNGGVCTNSNGKVCVKYTLTATLSDGKKYTLNNLN